MDEKDVELLLNGGNLVIRGEMKSETEDKERQFSERFYGRFERQIQVGADIEEDKVEAWFNSGVLKVTLPKTGRARTQSKTHCHQNPNQTLMLVPRGSWGASGASCRVKPAAGKPGASPGVPVSRSEGIAEPLANAREVDAALTQTP
jgi:hypothetical protein